MKPWKLSDQQIRSFVNWSPKFINISGQRTLLSFSTRSDRCGGPPMYWMEKTVVIECIEKAQSDGDMESFYEFIRQGVALREDWGNNLMYAFELNVPKGRSVWAWGGLAQPQQVAMKARRLQERIKEGRSLVFWGGFQQYIIDQSEKKILNLIGKPFSTDSLLELSNE